MKHYVPEDPEADSTWNLLKQGSRPASPAMLNRFNEVFKDYHGITVLDIIDVRNVSYFDGMAYAVRYVVEGSFGRSEHVWAIDAVEELEERVQALLCEDAQSMLVDPRGRKFKVGD